MKRNKLFLFIPLLLASYISSCSGMTYGNAPYVDKIKKAIINRFVIKEIIFEKYEYIGLYHYESNEYYKEYKTYEQYLYKCEVYFRTSENSKVYSYEGNLAFNITVDSKEKGGWVSSWEYGRRNNFVTFINDATNNY